MAKKQNGLNLVLNILWIIFFGWEIALFYFIAGLILYITIIGIPFGKQLFKLGLLFLFPFGAKVTSNFMKHPILNILWIIFFGWETAIFFLIGGLILCITVIGIPLGMQCFKFAVVSFMPFGANVR